MVHNKLFARLTYGCISDEDGLVQSGISSSVKSPVH